VEEVRGLFSKEQTPKLFEQFEGDKDRLIEDALTGLLRGVSSAEELDPPVAEAVAHAVKMLARTFGNVATILAPEHVALFGSMFEGTFVREAFREATAKYGCVDILVNNAGVSESTPFMDYTEETFDKVMDLNVKGVFNATRAAAECMVARGSGVILSTSSMVSISGQPSGFAYPASKFAVNGLTISLARELGPKGIRVNAVAPGITETDMMKSVPKEVIDPMIARIPLRRLGQPEDIANAFVFLASDEASYITGVVLSVEGMARS
jgi:3-oxoacyl-[acyl-carrier protein] reductase/7-alpha-hydroxysteroid dehydrogenase